MPSTLHEAFVEFVRQRPAFVAEVLSGPLKVRLPEFGETRLDSIDFTNTMPALAHGAQPGRREIFQALLAALAKVDDDHEQLYYDLVFAGLPEPARHDLEEMMAVTAYSEFRSEFLRNLAHKNRAEGEAKAMLTVLAARDIDVPDDARARITSCTDLDQLETWVRRAATATSVNDLFEP